MSKKLWASGLWGDNPALIKLLGLCPLLAVSNTGINALALGIATLITLIVTNILVSLLSSRLQYSIRIPVYVLIIASTVSAIELLLRASLPALHASLGIFLPLVVTNCLIIGRAEAFASRHRWQEAGIDATAMGIGFLWVLVCMGALRELLGRGTLFADAHLLFGQSAVDATIRIFDSDHGLLVAILPPGAFLALGCLLALKNAIDLRLQAGTSDRTTLNPITESKV
ncbi:MAG: electron transport complex subunit E [Granulosicoccus sp.]